MGRRIESNIKEMIKRSREMTYFQYSRFFENKTGIIINENKRTQTNKHIAFFMFVVDVLYSIRVGSILKTKQQIENCMAIQHFIIV